MKTGLTLHEIARVLMTPAKGILAADGANGLRKNFEAIKIADSAENRRNYRSIFITTDDLEAYTSGIILHDETAHQATDDGQSFVDYLLQRGVMPGVKVDQGLEDLPNFPGEKVTLGLDTLKTRFAEYAGMGLTFAKWRAAFEITGAGMPSDAAIAANVQALTRYALDAQEAGLVPIVEPELVYDGKYPLEVAQTATSRILYALFSELNLFKIDLAGTILKVNMVMAGKQHQVQSTPEEVAKATSVVLREHVPEALAGVVFLSGGQTPEQATANLQAITNLGPYPWPVTFSFERALQGPAFDVWQGKRANFAAAQQAFMERLEANALALIRK